MVHLKVVEMNGRFDDSSGVFGRRSTGCELFYYCLLTMLLQTKKKKTRSFDRKTILSYVLKTGSHCSSGS